MTDRLEFFHTRTGLHVPTAWGSQKTLKIAYLRNHGSRLASGRPAVTRRVVKRQRLTLRPLLDSVLRQSQARDFDRRAAVHDDLEAMGFGAGGRFIVGRRRSVSLKPV